MFYSIVDLRPKRAHNIFAGRRNFTKIFRLQIKMSILPGLERFCHRVTKGDEIVERSALLVVLPANRRFGHVTMTVAAGIIAFAEERDVLFIGKRFYMQSVRRAKRHSHSEKHAFVIPNFREKIVAFVQADTMKAAGSR